MKVHDLLKELKSFQAAGVTDIAIIEAEQSGARVPGELMEAWMNGEYDEDLAQLVHELRIEVKMHNDDRETRRIYG